ncbi:MAG: hypothetical protein AAF694_14815 [Bacteroidota bacterium]
MIHHFRHLLVYTFLFSLLVSTSAQISPISQNMKEWYLEERFLITDGNDDALLDRKELAKFSNEFAYYLVDHHFNSSDINRDGYLSFNEIRSRVQTEMKYRTSIERRELRKLVYKFPKLPSNDIGFFYTHPEVVAELFGNLTWMYENASVAKHLLSNYSWTSRHPEVMVVLQKNLRWMVANPLEADRIYTNRDISQQLPELLGWRADHRNFIKQNRLSDKFYLIDFSSID